MANLEHADSGSLSFFSGKRFLSDLQTTEAGVVILSKENSLLFPGNSIYSENPYATFSQAVGIMKVEEEPIPKRDQSAIIDDSAVIADNATIGAGVIIEAGVVIGEQVLIGNGSSIHRGVEIARSCRIGANVVISGNGLNTGAATDFNGEYIVNDVPIGTYTIKITYIGYSDFTGTVELSEKFTYIQCTTECICHSTTGICGYR